MNTGKYFIIWMCMVLVSNQALPFDEIKWNQILNLTNEEIKFLEKKDAKPENTLRLIEAYSERLKLIFEKENNNYLTKSENQEKSFFFKNTQEEYERIEKIGKKASEEIYDCGIRSQILYRLAVNSKNYGNSKSLEEYLLEAIEPCSNVKKSTSYFAEEMLADYYMNNQKFTQAITHFTSIINKKPLDKFVVRNYYQLAWAYLKTSKPKEALASLERGYGLMIRTESTQFKDQIMRLKMILFISNNKIEEGINFFNRLRDPQEKITYLLLFAEACRKSGKKSDTFKILSLANESVEKNNFHQRSIEVKRESLLAFEEFKMFDEYLRLQRGIWGTDKKLKAVSTELKDEVLTSLKKITNYLDALIKKDKFQDNLTKNPDILNLYDDYLRELIFLDPENKSEYYYFLAESYFMEKMFTLASKYYLSSLLAGSQKNSEERKVKAFNALFNIAKIANDSNIEDSSLQKNLDASFELYLKLNPKGDYASDIFPSIISRFIKNEKFEDAISQIEQFSKLAPSKTESQQILELELIDKIVEKKQLSLLIQEAYKIRTGFLGFDKSKSEQIDENLSKLIFSRKESDPKNAKNSEHNQINLKILKDDRIPNSIKSIAAINLASYYSLRNDPNNSRKIFEFSLNNMRRRDLLENKKKIIDQLLLYALIQDFPFAEKNSKKFLIKVCDDRDSLNDSLFRIYLNILNAGSMTLEKIKSLNDLKGCLSQNEIFQNEISTIISDYILSNLNNYHEVNALLSYNSKEEFVKALRKEIMTNYYLKILTLDNLKKISLNTPGLGLRNNLLDLTSLEQLTKETKNFRNNNIWEEKEFNPDRFNSHLETYLNKLAQKISLSNSLMKSEDPEIVLQGLNVVCELTFIAHQKISNLNPQGLDQEIKDDFLKEMFKISDNIQKNHLRCTKDRETFLRNLNNGGSFQVKENKFYFLNSSLSKLNESLIFLDRTQEDIIR